MKKFIGDMCADKLCARLGWLILAALVSVGLFRYCREMVYCALGILNEGDDGKLIPIAAVDGALLGVPVLIALWWFRTRDIREQINKTQAQIHQNNLAIGLNKLVESDSLQVAIGVQILRQVSIGTRDFDEEIRLAFIKRLQHLPADMKYPDGSPVESYFDEIDIQLPTLNYMPHIFDWLIKHAKRNKIDIENETIDVPEMYFSIEELESTKYFIGSDSFEFAKRIPLREIKAALEEYRRTPQMTAKEFDETRNASTAIEDQK